MSPLCTTSPITAFKTAGNVEVGIQFTREENPLFPRFHLTVLSPLEVAAKVLASSRSEGGISVMSALLAYLVYSDPGEAESNVDSVLCSLVHSVDPMDLPDWRLGPLLSGK